MTGRETAAIAIRDVAKSYGATGVLRHIDLDVGAGDVTAILGASGSGKTTLLRLIAGFDTVDRGRITIGGRVVDDAGRAIGPQHRGIGYVPQDAALFPHLNVAANVGFGVPRAQRRARVGELLELVGLAGLGRRMPHQLSGGQQQRVALARALAIRPQVVLLDEPFSSLDAALREVVRGEVISILQRTDTTTVLVTHDQDEALSLADRVVLLRDGGIDADGSPQDVYQHPASPQIAAAIGTANVLPGRRAGQRVHTAFGVLVCADAGGDPQVGPCRVLVRPEQLRLSVPPGSGDTVALVHAVRYHGHDTIVELEGVSGMPELIARSAGPTPPWAGAQVGVAVIGEVHTWPDPGGARPSLDLGAAGERQASRERDHESERRDEQEAVADVVAEEHQPDRSGHDGLHRERDGGDARRPATVEREAVGDQRDRATDQQRP
ncbi:ABC transporter ATP-binding protein [Flexivirga caeni]|uniref:ABC-type quaternary amine transporter n=1 Tax=Flexivirga caeni TaxID=2294115 RepID=A0A3M9M6V0_9MICO|nr:ABC transporter ATP-binding protein [Flexivirga caeni]RNI20937.1 ATP-binding cassette domain-containing protein [Flexivirga caeni]